MNVSKNQTLSIVFPKNTGKCLLYAAEELTYFLSERLGVQAQTVTDEDVPSGVIFSLGETALVKVIGYTPDKSVLNGDGFYIKTVQTLDVCICRYVGFWLLCVFAGLFGLKRVVFRIK